MARIGDLVSKLKIGNKNFNRPEWWSTTHKLKKQIKLKEACKANADLRFSYRVATSDSFSSGINEIRDMQRRLDYSAYNELAPWNPVFRKYKPIVLFKPKK